MSTGKENASVEEVECRWGGVLLGHAASIKSRGREFKTSVV